MGSEVSRRLNCNILNDCSGVTISSRTAKGLNKSFGLKLNHNSVVDLTHLGMIVSPILLKSSNPTSRLAGGMILGGLVLGYLSGN